METALHPPPACFDAFGSHRVADLDLHPAPNFDPARRFTRSDLDPRDGRAIAHANHDFDATLRLGRDDPHPFHLGAGIKGENELSQSLSVDPVSLL